MNVIVAYSKKNKGIGKDNSIPWRSKLQLPVKQTIPGITIALFDSAAQIDFIKAVWKSLLPKFPGLRYENFKITGIFENNVRKLSSESDRLMKYDSGMYISRKLAVELEVDYDIIYIAEEIQCVDCSNIQVTADDVTDKMKEVMEEPVFAASVTTNINNESTSPALLAVSGSIPVPEPQVYVLISFTSPRPTGQPSSQPTSQPSGKPSGQPSRSPSGQPSSQPSNQPTGKPSSQPSAQPSGQPSSKPSGQPSSKPSGQPTTQPSSQPTLQPPKEGHTYFGAV